MVICTVQIQKNMRKSNQPSLNYHFIYFENAEQASEDGNKTADKNM